MSETAVEMPAAVESADKPEPEVLVLDANSPAKKTRRGKSPKAKATPKAKAAVANKKQKKAVSDMHPKYSQMINEAISALKDRNGSSRQAILKYIMANYSVLSDEKLVNNHIKMSLRAGVKSGKLRQSKGSGACGSYKLGGKVTEKASKPKPAKATSPTKKASLTKVKKPKDMSKGAKSPAKKATDKSTPKSTPKKAKASPKKTPKVSKSPKKAKKEKAVKTPKKSKKQVESEAKTDAQPQASDSEATK